MAIEIERKFALKNRDWEKQVASSHKIRQGYLVSGLEPAQPASVRIRISDDRASLNIKSVTLGVERHEFEYTIPLDEADYMLAHLCKPHLIEKTRHIVMHAGNRWEIDIFEGQNTGLEMAELELPAVDAKFERPAWLGSEVSDDPRYYNIHLVEHPYNSW